MLHAKFVDRWWHLETECHIGSNDTSKSRPQLSALVQQSQAMSGWPESFNNQSIRTYFTNKKYLPNAQNHGEFLHLQQRHLRFKWTYSTQPYNIAQSVNVSLCKTMKRHTCWTVWLYKSCCQAKTNEYEIRKCVYIFSYHKSTGKW